MDDDEERLARKRRSIEILRVGGIPFIEHLPGIEAAAEARLRPVAGVAGRLLALAFVAGWAEGIDRETVADFGRERGTIPLLTPRERAFVDDTGPREPTRVQHVWRYEAAWTLAWALRLTDEPLGLPSRTCDAFGLVGLVMRVDDLAARGLRPIAEILDESDLIYRCHWATRQASLTGQDAAEWLDPGVTMERHHALNWLADPEGTDWDDVSTDT